MQGRRNRGKTDEQITLSVAEEKEKEKPIKSVLNIHSDKGFIILFNGKDSTFGSAAAWEDTYEWLESMFKTNLTKLARSIYACCQFTMQPKKFLLKGKTSKGEGDGVGVSENIVSYLPVLDDVNKRDVKIEKNSRQGQTWMANVNLSMAKRVALISIEELAGSWLYAVGWCARFGGRPSQVTAVGVKNAVNPNGENPESEKIWIGLLSSFAGSRKFWSGYNWSFLVGVPDSS